MNFYWSKAYIFTMKSQIIISNDSLPTVKSRSMDKKGGKTDVARPTIWLYIYMSCRRYSICTRNIQNRLLHQTKFLNQIKYRLLSMYILYMVGRAASVVSPFYFILLDSNTYTEPLVKVHNAFSKNDTCGFYATETKKILVRIQQILRFENINMLTVITIKLWLGRRLLESSFNFKKSMRHSRSISLI